MIRITFPNSKLQRYWIGQHTGKLGNNRIGVDSDRWCNEDRIGVAKGSDNRAPKWIHPTLRTLTSNLVSESAKQQRALVCT